jgi:hypothetical protein
LKKRVKLDCMQANPYKVFIVVDRSFGAKLSELERSTPVWIVDTPANKTVVQRFWIEHSDESHLTGVTTFGDLPSLSPEDLLLGKMEAIELHHGSYSADPPFTVIEVFGTQLTENARKRLSEYGFAEFHPTQTGYLATRAKGLD